MSKEFKSINEQIKLLESRGVVISDRDNASNILESENYYYLINGYKNVFLDTKVHDDKYKAGTSIEEISYLYNFDKEIKCHVFKYILLLESRLDTYIAYEFSRLYENKYYLKEANFNNTDANLEKIQKLIGVVNTEINYQYNNKNDMIVHYKDKYNFVPLWVAIRIISFGKLWQFYSLMKQKDQSLISKKFSIDTIVLKTYLQSLTIIRNICAHDEKLFDIKLKNKIHSSKFHKILNIKQKNGNYLMGVNDLFSIVIILKTMLNKNEFDKMYNNIIQDISELKKCMQTIKINEILYVMGFPANYRDLLYMWKYIKYSNKNVILFTKK